MSYSLLAYRQIRFDCQSSHELEELLRLADKESVGGESLECSHGCAVGFGRTNNRTCGKLPVEERRWLGHDQVSLEVLPTKRRRVYVVERHRHTGHRVDDRRQPLVIAGLVRPRLKMHDLGSANAEHDSQDFQTGRTLRELWIEAAATLLDGCKMKAGCVGD